MSETTKNRNVVLIILDTVRKDFFDANANRIRERSDVSIDQCRAASTWSVPSHASIFTGNLPSVHGIHAGTFGRGKTFSDIQNKSFLSSLDCRKIGFSANPYANSLFGFDSLFDEYRDFISHESVFPSGLSPYEHNERAGSNRLRTKASLIGACLSHDYPGRSLLNALWATVGIDLSEKPIPKLTDDGAKAITNASIKSATGSQPFFMFINYMDAHIPLRDTVHFDNDLHSVSNTWTTDEIHKWEINKDGKGTEGFFEKYRSLYSAGIDYLDRQAANLIDNINGRTDGETTFVITADHGHNLGYPADDRLVHHDGSASEGILHVPLEIVNPPDGYPERIEALFSHLSLGNLLTNLVSGKPWDEKLIRDKITAEVVGLGGTGDPRNYRTFEEGEYQYWDRLIRCVYRENEKLQWDSLGNQSRYRLSQERPCWQSEIEGEFDARAIERTYFETSAVEYKEQVSTDDETGQSDGVVEERLRDLGYM